MLGFLLVINPWLYIGLKSHADWRHAMVGLRGPVHHDLMRLFYPV